MAGGNRKTPRTSTPRVSVSQSRRGKPGSVRLSERKVLQALALMLGSALASLFYLASGVLPKPQSDGHVRYTSGRGHGGRHAVSAASPLLNDEGIVGVIPSDKPEMSGAVRTTAGQLLGEGKGYDQQRAKPPPADASLSITSAKPAGFPLSGREDARYERSAAVLLNLTVGTKIEVLRPEFDVYCPATITKMKYVPSSTSVRYTILYDDGEEVKGVDLAKEKVRVVGKARKIGPEVGSEIKSSDDVKFISNLTIGCSISVYWSEEEKYYKAEIIGKKRGSDSIFKIRYDDGETGIVDLTKEKFAVIGVRYRQEDVPQRLSMLRRAKMESDFVQSSNELTNVRQRSTGLVCSAAAAAAVAERQARGREVASEAPKLRGIAATTKDGAIAEYEKYNFRTEMKDTPNCTENLLSSADISYTLVSQTSDDRLWMVTQHCKRWPGPMSISIFSDKNCDYIQSMLRYEAAAENGGCSENQVHIQTLPTKGYEDGDYPINKLRNMALSSVNTTHAIYVDIDFWPSGNLYDVVAMPFVRDELSRDDKLALVIPAFEYKPECHKERKCQKDPHHILAMPRDKAELVGLIMGKKAGIFDPTNAGGYQSTRYNLWFNMIAGDLMDIPCITSNRYEPFVVVRLCREYLPPYQEAFTGYGKNKISTIMQMRRLGYQFSQLGGAFFVHYPHERSKTREVWNVGWQLSKNRSINEEEYDLTEHKFYQVDKIFNSFKAWMRDALADQSRVPMCNTSPDDDAIL